ncbi:MAG TPA: beta-galactosidase GalA [Polyangiaceae bacterium]|nr:beta-galactosidase GalA [Polyangiaceae bacterium]
MDRGFRFALGHASDTERDFGHGTSYFSYLAKAGYGDGPADPDFDDRSFREVRLPHDWAVELPFDERGGHSHGYKALGRRFPENSVGWYRRELEISSADLGRRIALEFDGVFRDSRVFVNGFLVGREPSGYLSARYDVSDYLNYGGRNVLAVRVDASQEEGWFYEGAGIYRHVWLSKTAPVHVAYDGTAVTSTVVNGIASVNARANVVAEGKEGAEVEVRFEILAADDTVVARGSAGQGKVPARAGREFASNLQVDAPKLWSLESPTLYLLVTEVIVSGRVVDRHLTRFGIRTIRFDPDRGFFLNGQHVLLKGTNNHQDHAGVGTALPDRLQEFRLERLKAMGSNAYRASHHPPTPELLDACDRLGMLVIDENRLMGSSQQALSELERMIARDRNHPSVILWSLGNEEWAIEGNERGARIAATMTARARELDPSRPSTVASSGGWDKGVSTVSEVMGYNYIVHGDTDAHHRQFPWQPGVGTEETTTQGTRGIYFTDEKRAHSAPVTNGSSGGNVEVGLRYYAARPYLAGLFYWTGFDYRGESNPYGFPAISSQFGILDTCGFPKDSFHYLSAWWRDEPLLQLAPHWNFGGREGQAIDVRAFSNASEVELFLNGRSLGRKPVERYGHAAWSVPYEAGVLSATGFVDGAPRLQARVETTSAPAALRLEVDRATIVADDRDLAVVTATAIDDKGRSVPTADASIAFAVEGGGQILGVGNGDPSSHEPDRVAPTVTTLAFSNFREHAASGAEDLRTVRVEFDDSRWKPAFSAAPHEARVYRGTLLAKRLALGARVRLLLRHFGGSSVVYLNGKKLGSFALTNDAPLPSVELSAGSIREGRNVLSVIATPFENDKARERAQKVPPALVRLETPAAPWRRQLFNGFAQLIVQSNGQAGPIRITASAAGLTSAELRLTAAPPGVVSR